MIWNVAEKSDQKILKFYLNDIRLSLLWVRSSLYVMLGTLDQIWNWGVFTSSTLSLLHFQSSFVSKKLSDACLQVNRAE